MSKFFSKRNIKIREKIDFNKYYDINQAIFLLKERKLKSFIESVDVAINLGIDPKKSEQNIRGTMMLPHGIGRNIKVAVFTKDMHKDAINAGAEYVGSDDLAKKIEKNNLKIDIVISSPEVMDIVSKLGPILGPKNLMPNPKMGTITTNIYETVKNAKSGQIRYKNDKNGIIHSIIGKISFEDNKIKENLEFLIKSIKNSKPISTKGLFLKKITLSTTMGIGIKIDINSLNIN